MAKNNKVSEDMERELKRMYPESHALDQDRVYRADTVLDPDNPEDVMRWSERKDRLDLEGFDTPSAREPPQDKVLSQIYDGESGEEALIDEADRFAKPNSVAGKLIEEKKDKIYDYQSLIKAVEDAWKNDDALNNLYNKIPNKERAFQELFRHPIIQGYIDENTRPLLINYVMKRYGVEPVRASNIVNKLTPRIRSKLFNKSRRATLPKIRMPPPRRRGKLPKKAGRGRRWSEQEINIIRSNRTLSVERVTEIFRNAGYDRSISAIRNKIYRIRRGEM